MGARKRGVRLSGVERAELQRLVAAGETQERVAELIGCDVRTVIRWIMHDGGLRPYQRRRSPLRLSLEERERIVVGIAEGKSAAAIARELGRSSSTVSREIARNGGRFVYRAAESDRRALERALRPRLSKLAACSRLRAEVERRLDQHWSPEQIAARLCIEFPDDSMMRVSHEAIYQALFVDSRRALPRRLAKRLRTRRVHRRPRGRRQGGPLRNMVLIEDRPAEINQRTSPGHWEGDLIIGGGGRSAVATLVERQSRYTVLVPLPDGRTAASVTEALTSTFNTMPRQLLASLTWDQGKEMADHEALSAATGIPIYFCKPSCPWQRGTNENTNGLLRQYLPKGTDLAAVPTHQLQTIADELNGRPRRILGWMTPSERYAQISAMTA